VRARKRERERERERDRERERERGGRVRYLFFGTEVKICILSPRKAIGRIPDVPRCISWL